MITLGIECSSRQGSLALLKGGEVIGEKSWIAERVRHNTVFQTLENLMDEAELSYSDICLYAVGRGPGSFSGMRMSFAIAQALALPEKKEVRAISSGAALALQVARQAGMPAVQKIAVVGDARRGQVWFGLFKVRQASSLSENNLCIMNRLEACPALVEDWKLVPYDKVSVPEGTIVVSPEAERLGEIFPTIGNARFPHAKEVALLAQAGSEDLEPLYMHPPVFVEPKFS
ncbi:MAG TPA: tRNA (adenosine(37)-N6)-threonylcarbamoyltransferase complex dimerization subunit type 1 TsaB [Tichowtungia sp.]|nr:tRNA (adenosine(37)-N6)-threonylcarbamoyltransferase complex dimerization subunit type 1 TsaB [Tichowtungia sp.]